MFNIFETERVRIENKFFEKIIDILIRITKKLKWKKIETENETDVIMTIENEYHHEFEKWKSARRSYKDALSWFEADSTVSRLIWWFSDWF